MTYSYFLFLKKVYNTSMEQESQFEGNNSDLNSSHEQEGFNYQSLSEEEQSRLVTLKSGEKVVLTRSENTMAGFDPRTGKLVEISPEDIVEDTA